MFSYIVQNYGEPSYTGPSVTFRTIYSLMSQTLRFVQDNITEINKHQHSMQLC